MYLLIILVLSGVAKSTVEKIEFLNLEHCNTAAEVITAGDGSRDTVVKAYCVNKGDAKAHDIYK